MAELDYITIKGFKSLKAVEELKLNKCNVVIGANGSGKSNFIESFAFLQQMREGRLQEYVVLLVKPISCFFLVRRKRVSYSLSYLFKMVQMATKFASNQQMKISSLLWMRKFSSGINPTTQHLTVRGYPMLTAKQELLERD